ncbi:DUF6779 domain-containing protein [Corynebacterium parakroppenstedtii]|uniref:DUF6779 domain-containing protein n=1 Tax=Corynebacterium parakroppenstedtii TaxID=2828363 RepID=UPI001C8D4B0B|nr:DUF6779 domain-containing protein [Corynebacterium parakroppenstedtii]MBY0795874.1 hypothetical protein [Corynebacterium parakroppenstedtii]
MTGPQQSHDGYDSSNNQGHYDDQSPDYRDDYPPANTGGSGKFSFAAIVVMLVFAVVATILMLFTDSETWTKIAVLCALWAAIVGCIAVARLRKQVDNQQRDTDNLERLHQAELERELATHREQELILEQNYYDSLQEQEQNTLADIRAELTVLRENLSAMMGTDLDTERTALKAEAQRILELERDSKDSSSMTEARTSGSTSRTSSVPASSHAPSGKRGQNRGGAGQTQGARKTSGAGNTAADQPGRANQASSRSRAADSTSTQQGDNSLRTGSFNAVKWTAQPSRRSGSGYSADQTTVLPSVEKKSNPQAQRSTGYGTSQQRASQPSQQRTQQSRPQQQQQAQQQPTRQATQQQFDRAAQNNQRSATQGSAVYRGADRDNSQFFAFGAGSSPASSAQPASGSSQPQASRTESTPYIGSHRGPNPNANSKQNRSTAQSSSTTGGSRRSTDPDTGSFAAFGSGRSSAPSYDRTHAPTTGGFRAQSPSSGPTPASGSQSSGHSSHEGMFTGSQSYGSSASSSNTSDPRGRHEGPQDSSSGGRRRRADNGDSSQNVTVASLLEQLKKNSEK